MRAIKQKRSIGEHLLYPLAKLFYRTELAHTEEMKGALRDPEVFRAYRQSLLDAITTAAARYGVTLADKVVLDLGCGEAAITSQFVGLGARRVIGVDIDAEAIRRAKDLYGSDATLLTAEVRSIPVPTSSIDLVVSYDVFEHLADPRSTLAECYRVLKPGGQMLIGTWGWYHPYAPHLWSTMAVPWVHLLFSERTILRTCRRVYESDWYIPTMHDLDDCGNRRTDKYLEETISTDYLNKFLMRDFERLFDASGFDYQLYPEHFHMRFARWTRVFLYTPWLREFVTGYFWVVLEKPHRADHAPIPNVLDRCEE